MRFLLGMQVKQPQTKKGEKLLEIMDVTAKELRLTQAMKQRLFGSETGAGESEMLEEEEKQLGQAATSSSPAKMVTWAKQLVFGHLEKAYICKIQVLISQTAYLRLWFPTLCYTGYLVAMPSIRSMNGLPLQRTCATWEIGVALNLSL